MVQLSKENGKWNNIDGLREVDKYTEYVVRLRGGLTGCGAPGFPSTRGPLGSYISLPSPFLRFSYSPPPPNRK